MKRKDLILIAVILIAALAGFFIVRKAQSGEGARVVITVDGKTYGTYSPDEHRTIEIKDDLGYNKVVIADGTADVTQADCPDKICVDHAPISRDRETIICLPHKLVVEVKGGEASEIDAKTR